MIDCCTRQILGWHRGRRCRVEEPLPGLNRAVLEVLPAGPRGIGLTLTTHNGTQFTPARHIETLNRLGMTHRRTAYNHPEGNSYIERFHRILTEKEVWLNECRNFQQNTGSIGRRIEAENQNRPSRGLNGQTPLEARARAAQTLTSIAAPPVQLNGAHYSGHNQLL